MNIPVGTSYTASMTVKESDTAKAMGSGLVDVLATPAMIALMELAASECIKPYLDDGHVSVGGHVNVGHTAATPVGMKAEATATVTAVDRRRVDFDVFARDGLEEIGRGKHVRFIVDIEKFCEKATAKNRLR